MALPFFFDRFLLNSQVVTITDQASRNRATRRNSNPRTLRRHMIQSRAALILSGRK